METFFKFALIAGKNPATDFMKLNKMPEGITLQALLIILFITFALVAGLTFYYFIYKPAQEKKNNKESINTFNFSE